MKNVIVVDTTYRAGGNCAILADKLAAEIPNARVEVFRLKEHTVNPCVGCCGCKGQPVVTCVQKDDMSALIRRLDESDALAILAPIYYGGIAGQAKIFVDRLYAFSGNEAARRKCKKAAMICTCAGGPAHQYARHAESVVSAFPMLGMEESRVYVCNDIYPAGAVREKEEHLQAISEIARWLGE